MASAFDSVRGRVRKAALLAVDQTTGAAVIRAKSSHPWTNRTGTLEGSYVAKPAQETLLGVGARWGSFDVDYAAPVEEHMPALRPAADAEYPDLPARIRKLIK